MSHTWGMRGKWENQEWDYSKSEDGEIYVTVTEKCIQHFGKCGVPDKKLTFLLVDGNPY